MAAVVVSTTVNSCNDNSTREMKAVAASVKAVYQEAAAAAGVDFFSFYRVLLLTSDGLSIVEP